MSTLASFSTHKHGRFHSEIFVLTAILKKEWLHTIRYPSWVIQLIIWPLIFPAAYILSARAFAGPDQIALQYFIEATGSQNYIGFIVIGAIVWMWQNIVLWNVGLTLRNEQLRGTLESNWLSPSWRFSLLIGASLVQMITIILFVTITFLEYHFLFKVPFIGNFWVALLVFLSAIPAIYGIGITLASLVIRLKEANAFVYLVRGMVMVFCGVSFPVSILPGWMSAISKWLPQTYLIRAIRSSILTNSGFQAVKSDVLILLAFGLFWMVSGYLTFNWMERLSRKSGVIGQY